MAKQSSVCNLNKRRGLKETRTKTEIWLIGQPLSQLHGSKPPSNGDVLRRLFHLLRNEKRTFRDSATTADTEVIEFWHLARVPATQVQNRIKKVEHLYNEWRCLGKRKTRKTIKEERQRVDFRRKLRKLFDVAHLNALKMMKTEEDRAFLKAQQKENRHGIMLGIDAKLSLAEAKIRKRMADSAIREQKEQERRASSDISQTSFESFEEDQEEDPVSEPSTSLGNSKNRTPSIHAVTPDLSLALDRTKTSDRNAVHILSAAASAYGQDPSLMTLSRQSIRRARMKTRTQEAAAVRAAFKPNVPLTVHWDSKLVSDVSGRETFERLPILISGEGVMKLLNVPKLKSGTGAAMAEAIFSTLHEWQLTELVSCIAFDTTASNTGIRSGACTLLQQKMEKELLHLACRKHIGEIVIEKIFSVCTGIISRGPDIQLFKRFKIGWPSIEDEHFEPFAELPPHSDEILDFCYLQLGAQQPRDDYRELLELTVILLRGVPSRGKPRISRPGACHRARWMAKIIYAMKIYLFRGQFKLTVRELVGLERFIIFTVTMYIPYWFAAPVAACAPRNDLKFLKDIMIYTDPEISSVAARTFSRHLWYLSEEMVGLAFFDESLDLQTKREMVLALEKEGNDEPEKRTTVELNPDIVLVKTLPDFITSTTRRFPSFIGVSAQFLSDDPSTWPTQRDYVKAVQRVKALKVTNDFAERGVALMQDFIHI